MSPMTRAFAAAACLLLVSCSRSSAPGGPAKTAITPPAAEPRREIRITGVVQAVHSVKITVPIIQSQASYMTLTMLVPNGSHVEDGDLVARFDPTQQSDAARDARAKFEDLGHQVDQRVAENRVSAEKRLADLKQAEADLSKAKLELTKSSVLATLDVEENKARAEGATAHLESLRKSQAFREKAEAAALKSLELQRDRQKINMQRAQDNIQKMELRARLSGMAVHDLTYRASSYGHAQIGDQMYRSYPLVSIFDPSEMEVRCSVNEADARLLKEGSEATVHLDAYPEVSIPATFAFASPVASSPLGAPIRSFAAIFKVRGSDPHLLPDLSAAVVVGLPRENGGGK
jgi:HlyD family secretion protein